MSNYIEKLSSGYAGEFCKCNVVVSFLAGATVVGLVTTILALMIHGTSGSFTFMGSSLPMTSRDLAIATGILGGATLVVQVAFKCCAFALGHCAKKNTALQDK